MTRQDAAEDRDRGRRRRRPRSRHARAAAPPGVRALATGPAARPIGRRRIAGARSGPGRPVAIAGGAGSPGVALAGSARSPARRSRPVQPVAIVSRSLAARAAAHARLAIVSHPSLGLPPRDLTAGFPDAAARIRASAPRLAARALRDRHRRATRRSASATTSPACASSCATPSSSPSGSRCRSPRTTRARPREYADWTVAGLPPPARPDGRPRSRCARASARRCRGVLAPGRARAADAALDAAIEVYRWHRRLAGDARKRNRLLAVPLQGRLSVTIKWVKVRIRS